MEDLTFQLARIPCKMYQIYKFAQLKESKLAMKSFQEGNPKWQTSRFVTIITPRTLTLRPPNIASSK